MPNFIVEIVESYESVTRPVIIQVLSDIKESLWMPDDAEIIYLGNSKQLIDPSNILGGDKSTEAKFLHNNRVIVSVESEYPDDTFYSGQPFRSTYQPIFFDIEHDIIVSPNYHDRELVFSVEYVTADRPTMLNWQQCLKRKKAQSLIGQCHRLDYSFAIPMECILTLKHLYDLQCLKIDFGLWLKSISEASIGMLSNQSGSEKVIAVFYSQLGSSGVWTFNDVPEPSSMDTGDEYTLQISYRVRYELPATISMEYPVMIGNKIIDPKYRTRPDDTDVVLGKPGIYRRSLDYMRPYSEGIYPCTPIRLPDFDEWSPSYMPLSTATVYTALLAVDIKNPRYAMTLNELGNEYVLSDWLVELLNIYCDKLCYLGHSPVLVSLYRGDNWLDEDKVSVNKRLDLTSTSPLVYGVTYHVRLSLYTDLTLLSSQALDRLRVNGVTTLSLFALFLEDGYELPEVLSDGSLSPTDMFKCISDMKNTHFKYKNGLVVNRRTVSTSAIFLKREKTDAISRCPN